MTKEVKLMEAIEEELMDLSTRGELPVEIQELIDAGCLAVMQARNKLQLTLEQGLTEAASAAV